MTEDLLYKATIKEKTIQLSCLYQCLIGAEGLIRSQRDAQLSQGIGNIAGIILN
ncbi:MAG: hypothetical protein WBF33_08680 [Candidatus Nitrosopolaris sp.]